MRIHAAAASFFVALAIIAIHPSSAAAADTQASPLPSPAPSPSAGPFDHLRWRSVGPAASGGRVSAVAGSATDPFL